MLLNKLLTKINGYHKGSYIVAKWMSQKEVNGVVCVKITKNVVRFVNYENMAKTKAKRQQGMVAKATSNGGKTIIKDVVYQANNGSVLVSIKTTNNKNHKPQSTYMVDGVVVDKDTYQAMVKPSAYNDSGVFTIKLENLLELGK